MVTALHVRKKKKKFAECPTPKKKKNPKPSEKNLRVGLADGIIKASPEPRLALPLRQPPGEQPRPAGPAPSPMDLRAGRSLASEALAPAPAREPRDPVPVPPPGAPSRGRAGEPGATPASRARAGGGTAGRPREGPGGNAAFLKSTPRGQEVAGSAAGSPGDPLTRRAGNLEPLRDGVPGSRRKEPRAKVGESPWRGAGLREGNTARREKGAGEEEGRRAGSPRPGRREARGGRHLGPAALPPRPAGRGGREGGRARGEEGGGQSRAWLGRAGPGCGTRGFRAARCAAGAHHAARGRGAGGR